MNFPFCFQSATMVLSVLEGGDNDGQGCRRRSSVNLKAEIGWLLWRMSGIATAANLWQRIFKC